MYIYLNIWKPFVYENEILKCYTTEGIVFKESVITDACHWVL